MEFEVLKGRLPNLNGRLAKEEANLQTEFTQPAILLVSSVAHRLFIDETGIKPTLTLGHSLGEFSALVASNALDIGEAVSLVNLRGKLMAYACRDRDVGMLVSLGLSDEVVEDICKTQRERKESGSKLHINRMDQDWYWPGAKRDLEGSQVPGS